MPVHQSQKLYCHHICNILQLASLPQEMSSLLHCHEQWPIRSYLYAFLFSFFIECCMNSLGNKVVCIGQVGITNHSFLSSDDTSTFAFGQLYTHIFAIFNYYFINSCGYIYSGFLFIFPLILVSC